MKKLAVLLFAAFATSAAQAEVIQHFSLKVGAVHNKYGLMKADLVVDNQNGFGIADVRFTCVMYAESGTEVRLVNLVILKNFAAKSKTTVKAFDIGFMPAQAKTMNCTETIARRAS